MSEREIQSRLQKLTQGGAPPRSLRGTIDARDAAASEEEIQQRIREEAQKLVKQAEEVMAQREQLLAARERALAAHQAGLDLSSLNAETVARVGELEAQLREAQTALEEASEAVERERYRADEMERMVSVAGEGYDPHEIETLRRVESDLRVMLQSLETQVEERDAELGRVADEARAAQERFDELEKRLADTRAESARLVDPEDMRGRIREIERRADEAEARAAAAEAAAAQTALAGGRRRRALGDECPGARGAGQVAGVRASAAAGGDAPLDAETAEGRIAILEEALFKLQLELEKRVDPAVHEAALAQAAEAAEAGGGSAELEARVQELEAARDAEVARAETLATALERARAEADGVAAAGRAGGPRDGCRGCPRRGRRPRRGARRRGRGREGRGRSRGGGAG